MHTPFPKGYSPNRRGRPNVGSGIARRRGRWAHAAFRMGRVGAWSAARRCGPGGDVGVGSGSAGVDWTGTTHNKSAGDGLSRRCEPAPRSRHRPESSQLRITAYPRCGAIRDSLCFTWNGRPVDTSGGDMSDIRSCVSEGRGGSRGRGRVSRGTADLSASGPRETWPRCGRACGSVADTRADEAAFHVERAETWFGGTASGWGTAESAKRNGMGRRRGDSWERGTVRRVTRTDGFVGGVREGRRIAGQRDTATVRRVRAGSGARMDGRIGSRGTGCRSAWRRCVNGRAESGA